MLISRKRQDDKEVNIYLNHKRLFQGETLKYLGIYLDTKFNFNAHIDHTVEKLIIIINRLARTARLQRGLGHKTLKTIYEGAIGPLLTYGAPIWEKTIRNNRNLTKYKRVQRLMNIKIAKAYRTVTYEASCVRAGVRPIQITIEQQVQTYMATKINKTYDAPMDVKYWRHPAELPTIREVENGTTYAAEVYTDGSKIGDNVGAAGIIFANASWYTN